MFIAEYDPEWPRTVERLAAELERVLAPSGAVVEHVGSTAVPGLAAKPRLDVLVGVRAEGELPEAAALLRDRGFRDLGTAGVAGRRYMTREEPAPGVNLQVVEHGGAAWEHHLLVRDFLRAHPEERRVYADAKRAAAAAAGGSVDRYSQLKAPAYAELLARAWRWALSSRPGG